MNSPNNHEAHANAGAGVPGTRVALATTGLAIGLLWSLNGATEPNAGGRSDQIQTHLDVSDAVLSLSWLGWPVGMWLASSIGGLLLERIGVRSQLLAGAALYWSAFALVGHADDRGTLFGVMLAVGIGNGLLDVPLVRLGPWYQRQKERELGEAAGQVNQTLMGLLSAGSVVAAVTAWIAGGFDVSVAWHLSSVGVIALGVTAGWAVWKVPNLKATDEDEAAPPDRDAAPKGLVERTRSMVERLRSTPWELRGAGVVGFCSALPVGVGYVWSTIYLARLGAPKWVAPLGLVAFTATEMAVRLWIGWRSKFTHREILRNPVKLTRAGAGVALAGLALVVLPARIELAVVGFGLVGGGMAPVAALAQNAAPRLWSAHKGAAAGLITRYIYTALVAGPAFIGPLSSRLGPGETATPLRIALGCLAVLPLTTILLARNLRMARVQDAFNA
jgi:hypothetical protein